MAERKTVVDVSMAFMYRLQDPGCHDPSLVGHCVSLDGQCLSQPRKGTAN